MRALQRQDVAGATLTLFNRAQSNLNAVDRSVKTAAQEHSVLLE